jgi:serine/threonine-protein kinase
VSTEAKTAPSDDDALGSTSNARISVSAPTLRASFAPTPARSAIGQTGATGADDSVLREAEIAQTRKLALSGLILDALLLLGSPLFGGDHLAKRVCLGGLVLAAISNAFLLSTANERRYHERHLLLFFALAPFSNAAIAYYVGIFGPVLTIFVLNLYTTCLSYSRTVALLGFVGSVVAAVVPGSLIAAGIIADPGLITVSHQVGTTGKMIGLVVMVVFFLLTYLQARATREVLVSSILEREKAVRLASQREALFVEARQDLERALHAGGLGRFTDQTLGDYKLGSVLGRGGMGEVYDASHVITGEPAAVKLLLPEVLSKPEFVRRFLREVRITRSLRSPNIVRVLAIGDESAQLPYLAMERLEGETLAQRLRRCERLERDAAITLVRQVSEGLTEAASAGIVHRDLKPQNLFATRDGVWKILDFGVSKLADNSSTLTQGEAVGTPRYMAPEQARGESVDVRADLYSLGAIAYRTITGHPPVRGDELAAILIALLSTMPVRPSSLVRLPPDVDRALAIALAKDKDDRFASATELADALERAFAGRLPDELRERARAVLAKHPWAEA